MNPFRKKRKMLINLKNLNSPNEEIRCSKCGETHRRGGLREEFYVCPTCDYHLPLTARYRIETLVDSGSFKEINRAIKGGNPLNFPGYGEKLNEEREKSKINDAAITGTAKIGGMKVVIGAMDNRFMMASMGMAVGEKITRAFEYARKKRLPVVMVSTSGGARMQEGIFSLFQMAKTSAAVKKHSEAGLLFISILTNPTTGGVTASFASLGDIIIAEPDALIGFAGPRVIQQTIGQELPEGFQRAEYLLDHGFVDMIVERRNLRRILDNLLKMH